MSPSGWVAVERMERRGRGPLLGLWVQVEMRHSVVRRAKEEAVRAVV